MRGLATAARFLTRIPVGGRAAHGANFAENGAKNIAKSGRWFPLIGALLGGIYCVAFLLLNRVFSPLVTAAFIVAMDAWLTGAMHLDGLADSADGFGGGWTREDVLRIMRDHAIGTYGAVAIALALAMKIAAIASFTDQHAAICALILAPMVGRWSAVLLAATHPYARLNEKAEGVGAPARFMGRAELAAATICIVVIGAALVAFGLVSVSVWRFGAAIAAATLVSLAWGAFSRRRIGGVTGDTLGAAIEIVECVALLCFAARHVL